MTWGKVDDKLHAHRKVRRISRKPLERLVAMGLWALALSHCCDHLTDGFVDRELVVQYAGSESAADKIAPMLVAAGLWEAAPGGWNFHDWAEYQPTRASVETDRAKWAERARKGGLGKAAAKKARDGLLISSGQAGDSFGPDPDPDPVQIPREEESAPPAPAPADVPELGEREAYEIVANVAKDFGRPGPSTSGVKSRQAMAQLVADAQEIASRCPWATAAACLRSRLEAHYQRDDAFVAERAYSIGLAHQVAQPVPEKPARPVPPTKPEEPPPPKTEAEIEAQVAGMNPMFVDAIRSTQLEWAKSYPEARRRYEADVAQHETEIKTYRARLEAWEALVGNAPEPKSGPTPRRAQDVLFERTVRPHIARGRVAAPDVVRAVGA